MNTQLKLGFRWDVESVTNGVKTVDTSFNLVPTEGMNHILEAVLNNGGQNPNWYIALFEGDYTPTAAITAAAFPAAATECIAYTEGTRRTWTPGNVANGVLDNVAAPAAFNFAVDKTIYGAALISDNTKGGGLGTVLSIVRFASPRINPELLNVKAGIALINS